jgi:integrase
MRTPLRVSRVRVRLTNTFVQPLELERYLIGRGQSLDKPQEIRDAVMAGLLLRRERTGRRSWHYGYTFGGRRGRILIGPADGLSVDVARRAATRFAADVAAGRDPVAAKRAHKQAAQRLRDEVLGTFVENQYREWAEVHLQSHVATLAALRADFGNLEIREGGKRGKGKVTKKGAGWWDRPMTGLTVFEVERWRREQIKLGNRASTVNRAWQRLRAALGKAVEWGVIDGPPLRVRRLRLDSRGRVRFLSTVERERLIAALNERERRRREQRERMNEWLLIRHRSELPRFGTFTDHLMPLVRLLLGSGLRRGEALSLRISDVDLESNLINVRGEQSKSGQSRSVPMTVEVLTTLRAWILQNGLSQAAQELLFRSPSGERIGSVAKAWGALMRSARIDGFRLHDCRHDYASRLAMAGVELFTIARLLGHSNVAMTQRYAHLSPDHLHEATRKLEKLSAA